MVCLSWTTLSKALYISSYLISVYVMGMFWLGHTSYNSARLEPDTDYLRWTTQLPAISVCQASGFNSSSLHLRSKDELDFIHGLVRPLKLMCRKCTEISSARFKSEDLQELAFKVIGRCKDLFNHCSLNGKHFDCCQRFGRLLTNKGICYSINSDMTQNDFQMSVSHFVRTALLHISVNFPVQVFIHDQKDVLFLRPRASVVGPRATMSLLYRTRETVVDHSARSLSVEQRGCVIAEEERVQGYSSYSRSSCRTACLAQAQLAVCGCHHHLLLGTDNSSYCDLRGLQCLDNFFSVQNKTTKSQRNSQIYEKCNCLPACDQQEVKVVWGKLKRNNSKIHLNLELISPPTERLVLKSRVEFLDVLVGFACFTRLFTSTSILDVMRAIFAWVYPRKICLSYRHVLY